MRQVTVKRGLDVRDLLIAFGGSGPLLACRLVDILGVRGRAGAAGPGQRLGVRAAHRRRAQRLRADLRPARRPHRPRASTSPARATCKRRAPRRCTPRASQPTSRSSSAAPTSATSARPTRCACRCPTATSDAGRRDASWKPSTPPTKACTATRSEATRAKPSSGSTCASPASARSAARRSPRRRPRPTERPEPAGVRQVWFDDAPVPRPRSTSRRTLMHGDRDPRARRSSRSTARPSRSTPASPARVDRWGNLLLTRQETR